MSNRLEEDNSQKNSAGHLPASKQIEDLVVTCSYYHQSLNMRYFYLLTALVASSILTAGCFATTKSDSESESGQAKYVIYGKVKHSEEGNSVIMNQFDPVSQNKVKVAETELEEDGSYHLEFTFENPDLFQVIFPARQTVMLAIDEGEENIEVIAEGVKSGSVEINGSPGSEQLLEYDRVRAESSKRLITPTYKAMRDAGKAGDPEAEVEAVRDYVHASQIHRRELLDFTEENIGGSIALYGTMLRWTGDEEIERLDRLVAQFAENYPDIPATSSMQDKVARYKRVSLGVEAPELSGPTPDGGTLALDDIGSKYTLIDFWASWCGPCISQVSDLQKVHRDFSDAGFEILSVSVDTKEDKWKSAIDRYSLDWLHISDVKGWKSPLAQAYNVTFVPYNFLVDDKGVIVAKNLHSKELYSKLDELLMSN